MTRLSSYQSFSSDANTSLAIQEILRIFWKLKAHYRIHKKPSLVLFLSQINPVHAPNFFYLKYTLFSHLHLGPGCFPFLSAIPTKILQYAAFHFLISTTCCAHLSHLDLTSPTVFGEEYRPCSYSFYSFYSIHNMYLLHGAESFLRI